jgi:hypothetical protein
VNLVNRNEFSQGTRKPDLARKQNDKRKVKPKTEGDELVEIQILKRERLLKPRNARREPL